MSKKILGLDIRRNAVAAVLVRSSIKGNTVEAHMQLPVAGGNAEAGLSDSIEAIAKGMDLTGSVCVASIPADLVSYRNMQVPFAEHRKIRQILPFELESILPLPVRDLITDFHTFRAPDQDGRTNIIAASVEKKTIETYLDALASCNIQPKLVTVGSYPLALYTANSVDAAQNALFIDLDGGRKTLIGVASGQVCIIRSLPAGPAASPMAESICTDVHRTLSAFDEISLLSFSPDRVIISGDGVGDMDLETDTSEISERLGYPVQRSDLASSTNMVLKRESDGSWDAGQMDNALALTLIETQGLESLDFRRGSSIRRKLWAENKWTLLRTGILAASVALLGLVYLTADFYYTKKRIGRLDDQIAAILKAAIPEAKTLEDPVRQMKAKLEEAKRASVLSLATEGNIRTIDILEQISSLIPQEIETNFTRLVIGAESVMITGDTDTFNSVDDMKSRLEQAELFGEVTITSTNMEKSGDRVRFKLKVKL